MENKIDIYCGNCGSRDVGRDALVKWNTLAQRWELSTIYDHGNCGDCGSEDLRETPLTEAHTTA